MAARAEGSAVAHPRNFKLTTLLRDTGHVLAGFARVPGRGNGVVVFAP